MGKERNFSHVNLSQFNCNTFTSTNMITIKRETEISSGKSGEKPFISSQPDTVNGNCYNFTFKLISDHYYCIICLQDDLHEYLITIKW